MKILIIGGTGNISRWFVPELLDRGDQCTLYNRGNTAASIPEGVDLWLGDRTDHYSFESVMQAAGTFDCVIDMVGFEPEDAYSVVRAFQGRIGQYIFCSTVDVYAKQQSSYPVRMEGRLGPSYAFGYAWKKWEMEKILRSAEKDGAFPLTIIRPGATYSEGWSPLITSFGGQAHHLSRLILGRRMILHGDGTVLWSMAHSLDVGRTFAKAAGNQVAFGKSYNVCGEEWMTWESMHRTVAAELGAPEPRFEYIPTRVLASLAPQQAKWCVDNFQFNNIFESREARRDLGFRYMIPYRQGVRRCLEHLTRKGKMPSVDETNYYETILAEWDRVSMHPAYE